MKKKLLTLLFIPLLALTSCSGGNQPETEGIAGSQNYEPDKVSWVRPHFFEVLNELKTYENYLCFYKNEIAFLGDDAQDDENIFLNYDKECYSFGILLNPEEDYAHRVFVGFSYEKDGVESTIYKSEAVIDGKLKFTNNSPIYEGNNDIKDDMFQYYKETGFIMGNVLVRHFSNFLQEKGLPQIL